MPKPANRGRPVDSREAVRAALRLEPDLAESYNRITRIIPKVSVLQAALNQFLRMPLKEQLALLAKEAGELGGGRGSP